MGEEMIKKEMKLLLVEVKKIIMLVISVITLFYGMYKTNEYIKDRGYITDKIYIGYVNNDSSKYFEKMLNMIMGGEIKKIIEINEYEEEEIKKEFMEEKIPVYIIVPKDFINSIQMGKNYPLELVGSDKYKFENNVIKSILNIGINYLTTTQSGVYATLDVAREEKISSNIIEDKILMPINFKYAMKFLTLGNDFEVENVSIVEGITLKDYYIKSISFFLIVMSGGIFLESIKESTNREVLNRYKFLGIELWKVQLNKILALTLILMICGLPLIYVFRLKYILVIILSSSIIFLIGVFSDRKYLMINIIFYSFFGLIFSGGLIPLVYLPKVFFYLGLLTPNYYVINEFGAIGYMYIIVLIVVLNVATYIRLRKKRVS